MTIVKKYTLSAAIVFLSFLLFLCPWPQASSQRIFDEAGLLTSTEISTLEEEITKLTGDLGLDLVVVTTDDTHGKSSRQYADDYYDQGGFGTGADKSGVLFLIDMDNRQAYLSTCGAGIDYFTDSRIDRALDRITPRLSDQDYIGAVDEFLEATQEYIQAGIPENGYRYDEETGKVTRRFSAPSWKQMLLFAGIAVVIGLIAAGSVAVKYKVRYQDNSYPYRENSRLQLTNQQDIFIRRYVTSHRIQNDSSGRGGGGSSTHTSSGGHTHGGGGRGF